MIQLEFKKAVNVEESIEIPEINFLYKEKCVSGLLLAKFDEEDSSQLEESQ